MAFRIVRIEEPQQADILAVATPLGMFNRKVGPPVYHVVLVLQIQDEEGRPTGGLFGEIYYDWLHIKYLVVPEELRGQGIGLDLMQRAERLATESDCVGVYLDTLQFQALPFYQKLGYVEFGRLSDYPRGVTHFFLRKNLPQSS